jgi:spore coat polysaccharide biosynthesis protein SpsF
MDGVVMPIGIIVQARMNSSRLPGKVLKAIGSEPLLERLLRRLRLSERADGLVVATGDVRDNQGIVELCRELGVECFIGSEENCLERIVGAERAYGFESIVRVTGDNPLTDPWGIDEAIPIFAERSLDYLDNINALGYPHGAGFEIIARRALEFSLEQWQMRENLEHVTWALRRHLALFRHDIFRAPHELVRQHYRLSVDHERDFQVVTCIYRHFGWRDDIRLHEIISFLDQHPELAALNTNGVEQLMRAQDLENWQLPIDDAVREAWSHYQSPAVTEAPLQ